MFVQNKVVCDGCNHSLFLRNAGVPDSQTANELKRGGWVFEDPESTASICICPDCRRKGITVASIYKKWWYAAD